MAAGFSNFNFFNSLLLNSATYIFQYINLLSAITFIGSAPMLDSTVGITNMHTAQLQNSSMRAVWYVKDQIVFKKDN